MLKPLLFLGVCWGCLCLQGVGCMGTNFDRSAWSTAMTSVPEALQWPMAILQLGRPMPSGLLNQARLNPACLIAKLVQGSMPNGDKQQPAWPPGLRSKIMYEAARNYNQEVWFGTSHREFLKVTEQKGELQVYTTLSIVTCERSHPKGHMHATLEAVGGPVNWFKADDIPCATVRMPNWLLTRKPLSRAKRRERQGVGNMEPDATDSRAGIPFISRWLSPFENEKQLSNTNGWIGSAKPWGKTYKGLFNVDYEQGALLDRRDSEFVDAGVNQIGFDWQESHFFNDYLSRMNAEACLDDYGTELCQELQAASADDMYYPFSYMPSLDRWTFNSSVWEARCAATQHQTDSVTCLEQEKEIWSYEQPDIGELLEAPQQSFRPDVIADNRKVFLDTCPSKLVLTPGNLANIKLGQDKFGDQHKKALLNTARDLQWQVYSRISKNGINKTPISTVFLTLLAGIEGLLAASSWEMMLAASRHVVFCFSNRPFEHKLKIVNCLTVVLTAGVAAFANLPAVLLLIEERRKINDARIDGDVLIDMSRRTSDEGDGFLANIFIVSIELKDLSSRWIECFIILCILAVGGIWILVRRIYTIKSSRDGIHQAFNLVGVIRN